MTIYLPYQQRVFNEKVELDEKRTKLRAFMDTDIYNNLPDIDRRLLLEQASNMTDYSRTLGLRIERFEPA